MWHEAQQRHVESPRVSGPGLQAGSYEMVSLVNRVNTTPTEPTGWGSLGTFGLHPSCLSHEDMNHRYGRFSTEESFPV